MKHICTMPFTAALFIIDYDSRNNINVHQNGMTFDMAQHDFQQWLKKHLCMSRM